MFEAHVLYLLRKYLGEYVEGLSAEALRISVWKGDVVLKDLKLKAEALNSLKLPVFVRAGFVGTITLKVPWNRLGKEPVVVLIDRVFVLAHPAPDGQTLKEEDREKLFEAKLQQIEEAELATLEATTRRSKHGSPPGGSSWLGSLVATIIGNLKISISNVHIRYEDSVSNPGHPFCSGVTLAKLAAVTMDEQGNETFDTSGALDKLRKSLQLQRLAVYHDSDSFPWKVHKNWEDLNPKEWTEIFEDGINEVSSDHGIDSVWALNRKYLVSPINGVLKYHRLGKQEMLDPEIPLEKASLVLSDVSLSISEAQYYDGIKLLETISRYKTYIEVSHIRPFVSVMDDPHVWWRYAAHASLQQRKSCHRLSWERISHLCKLRRRYVQLYANSLQQSSNVDGFEARQIEKDLDSKVIILWRLLAHAKVESVKSKEAAQRKGSLKRNWLSFGWRSSSEDAYNVKNSVESGLVEEGKLTKDEWQAINNLLSYEPEEDATFILGKDVQNMIQFLVNVSIGQAAARIININQTEILCGRFEQLQVTTKMYHKSICCDMSLKFYGLSAPEGSLAQSVSSGSKSNALVANFVRSPVGENVDWRLSATIAPCHVTVLMESYNRFLEFIKRSNAVSPTIALETATALQSKIEKVTRRAQEQFQMVLEEQSRFALDVDFDAPKVRVPLRTCISTSSEGHFLLDFGHFTLQTREDQLDEQRQSLYSRFYISGRDIAAFFIDCSSGDDNTLASGIPSCLPKPEDVDHFYSLVDRCGMSVIVDQIKIPHPSYPSTRISVQVPNLGMHFSPARYGRLMDLLNILYGSKENSDQNSDGYLQTGLVPWYPADLASDARILVWRGIGNSVAEWKPCFIVLSGFYLYVLESEASQTYQRCCSMVGRQVSEVSSTSVGGSLFSVAVSFRGVDLQKALESSNTLIIEFRDDIEKTTWLKELIQATYRASAPPALDILGESSSSLSEYDGARVSNLATADLVINGSLIETKLSIYGKTPGKHEDPEELILDVLASGGKVNLVRVGGDLTVKMKLHSLKIKDELQGRSSLTPQYLAYSVQKDNLGNNSPCTLESDGKGSHRFFLDDDDIFKDALPEFFSTPDQSFYSPNFEMAHNMKSNPFGAIDNRIRLDSADALIYDKELGKGRSPGEVFYEARDDDQYDFVTVTFVTRNPDSPVYEGIDTQMSICMSKLEFFCNRPTLVALIQFGLDLSLESSDSTCINELNAMEAEYSQDKDKTEENGHSCIRGLLGYGKSRVVFHLNMDVNSVCVFLNKEDNTQLAMFVQEKFLFDLKVHPSSISLEGTLGNLRLCDMSLGMDQCWGWLCDIHDQAAESLIKFEFKSYSAEDDDYEGHDYSLRGRLSAVRIVFLYRFVQEITAYFVELATPQTEEAIKFVDKVGGFEWLIQKYEIDGATALKLDLSLDTPTIIVPRNSLSKDFMQLDLGKLRVTNNFSWHGCQENDPSAVHLDVLYAEIQGINMAVGVNGVIGKPMMREGKGLSIQVRRSLRDVFRKVPTMSVEVKVGLLHCVISDKEYNVILDCAYMNISEEPRIPPSFRGNMNSQKVSIRMLADKVNLNSQILLLHTVVVVEIEIQNALLELYNGIDEESPLAQIALEDLWLSYRTTSSSEVDLYVTIPKFSVLDIRPDTKPEMRLMLGSSSDVSKQGFCNNPEFMENHAASPSCDDSTESSGASLCVPTATMLLMDYRLRSSSQSFVVRIQQPRVLVVLDFLLPVVEFFVPAFGTALGREEMLHPKNDPVIRNENIVLSEPLYKQADDVVYLSPSRQLIVDGHGVDEFTYDGCGGTICLSEEFHFQNEMQPIIIIGCGKKLHFQNVKIENAALLRKYTYLSNDSSYSASVEDGVEILFLDSSTSNIDDEHSNPQAEYSKTGIAPVTEPGDAWSQIKSLTFEAQVVSPEFTFYDGTKLSVDNDIHGEKLLRAKMDLSFMYAVKENDIWVRALVKDLTIEAGSGLLVLEPVDVSGGYTSVREKTNISMTSTDICIHLPLSVISLLLHLQSQAAAALQFGNADLLSPCSNFKKLWVSEKEHVPGHGLTFWRPQAPSNYAILGDCVTSRPIPPTQVVMAVSNTYGRVRKPLSFKLIGSFSNLQGLEKEQNQINVDNECSLWLPIAPPGYSALGCVAHVGNKPPPNHIVYCVRSDLLTSTVFSDCVFSVPSSTRVLSGFSIWRVDNISNSFYAHDSVDCPPKNSCFNLRQIMLGNTNRHFSHNMSSSIYTNQENVSQQGSTHGTSSSGWDILRSFSRSNGYYMTTPHFERIWWDKGCELRQPVSIWRPLPRPGFAILGDCIVEGLEPPALGFVFKYDNSGISAKPVQFTKVAHISKRGFDEAYFWYPIAPPGYASMGCIISKTDEVPAIDYFCCPRIDLVNQANVSELPISKSSSSKGPHCWSIWKVENQACTFLARSDHKKPSSRLAYNIGDCAKPKMREDIITDMKLGCLSITVLDSSCGMMTPILDTTITNLNLATHGRLEAMNAVLVCSIASSTFNRHIEAWEPFIEPFDGIFKAETFAINESLPPRIGKRIRIAATSTVNINISSSNLESLAESIISWRRQVELEKIPTKRNGESGVDLRHADDPALSALEEDDLQKVTIENKLGSDIYLLKFEQNSESIQLLHPEEQTSLWVLPPRFSDRLNVVAEFREIRHYIAVQIFESRELPITDDGNKHDFFCALRLVINDKGTDQQKLFPQSARTRCVKPIIYQHEGITKGTAAWNELFIFEIPLRGLANLEVEVTNLASRAGKGEVIGGFSMPIGNDVHALRRVASAKFLQNAADTDEMLSVYQLRRKGQYSTVEDRKGCGCLLLSASYYDRNTVVNLQRDMESIITADRDVGFLIGLSPDGPWEAFRSLLPLSVVPKVLDGNCFASEVVMKNGRKHAIFRALGMIVNDADIKVEVAMCPLSAHADHTPQKKYSTVTEEIFENQRYLPTFGWGNKFAFNGNDPAHWSTRDFSYSSKDFFEPSLPSGWKWTSAWTIEKSPFVDGDGWTYGADFGSLIWPPTSSRSSPKSAADCVRRRRWVRKREPLFERDNKETIDVFASMSPGSSAILPWRSMATDAELCLQVRPQVAQSPYTWGQMVPIGSGYDSGNDQFGTNQALLSRQNTINKGNASIVDAIFKLSQLEKKDVLLCCYPCSGVKQQFWLSIGSDGSVLHTELNVPVYDWKISINSPLKLENRLPYQAEFAIWERTNEGNRVERQRGLIPSGSSASIYSADLRKPLYLTLFVQGGWILEKEAVLIMNVLALDHASSFWMIHQQSKRRLRVSVERDMGGNNASPKTVRFFVPYWINNNSTIPLSYRVVEVESLDSAETDTLLISRAVKSAKLALKPKSFNGRNSISKRNVRVLEALEDSSSTTVMLSPQDYTSRSGILAFPSKNDAFLSPHVGIAVAVRHSDYYGPGISLVEMENKERVDVRAFTSTGSYYNLSAVLNMASDRTKVINFQPQILLINRSGRRVSLQQCGTQMEEWINPTDPPKLFQWQSRAKNEQLKVRLDGCKWSTPFSIENEGVMRVSMKNEMGNEQMFLRVEVRSGTKHSHYEVVFRLATFSSPYRIENRSMFLPVRFRQVGGTDDSWQSLPPNAAAAYFWEDIGRKRILEVLVDGTDPLKSEKYNIDEIMDHQPMPVVGGPVRALRLSVSKEGKTYVSRISDWMPESVPLEVMNIRVPMPLSQLSGSDFKKSPLDVESEFHITFELTELGISIIDHMPEEVLYVSLQNLVLSYSTGLGSGISRFKLRMLGIQVDNQLPFTPMPVLFRLQKTGDQLDNILKFSMTMQSNGSLDSSVYPYVGLQGPENCAFLVNIHEPIIWRLHEMIQQVNINRLYDPQTAAVSVDPIIQIGLLNISEIRFKVSMAMSPAQRPRGVLGFWSSLMTSLGNTEHMPVRINQRFLEEVCMRQSSLIGAAISNIQKDLLSQPLQLLSGVDILGNASSAFGHMSKGVAALSMDKKFIQNRQKKENKSVEDIGDVIREGGGAFAKGLFRGVTGILTKPLEGAKSSGVEGFVQGVGKGIIGAAAQPVSGVLDLLSKTTEGANAVKMKITSAITSEEQLLRRRLPRVISGDNLLHPYDEYKAQGQVILQLAESGTFFGQVDLFKVRGKFALSDAYEDHFLLPKGKILLVTHRRVLLLQQPTNIVGQRKFNPARDPCSVLWDVVWDDLAAMELVQGKKERPESPPSCLVLYLKINSTESKECTRVIKCIRESPQAINVYSSIEQVMNTYGPNHLKDMQKKVTKPYSPRKAYTEVFPKEAFDVWGSQDVLTSVPISSTFGTLLSQPQFSQDSRQ